MEVFKESTPLLDAMLRHWLILPFIVETFLSLKRQIEMKKVFMY